MKKRLFLGLLTLLMALAFCLAFTACDTDGSAPLSETYSYFNDNTMYRLTVTQKAPNAAAKAAFAPASGDTYILLITTGTGTQTSSGTVYSFSGGTLTLKPGQTSVTFTVQISGGAITKVSGNITLVTGDIVPGPDTNTGSNNNNNSDDNTPVNIAVTGVTLKLNTSLLVGDTETLYAAVEPANAMNKNVTWNSSNAAIATVSTGGVVTAVSPGTATITVMTESGDYTAYCTVTVSSTAVSVASVSLNKTSASLTVGGAEILYTTITPINATNQNLTWSSGNTGVATVSAGGVVTAVAQGTATITVMTVDGAKTASCTVTVTNPQSDVIGVSISPSPAYGTKGQTRLFSAQVFGRTSIPAQTVTWSVTGGGTGTGIDASGLLTVAAGETAASVTVRATSTVDTTKSGTATVTIIETTIVMGTGNGTKTDPLLMTGIGQLSSASLAAIHFEINYLGKYVNLDLSAMTMPGTDFDMNGLMDAGASKMIVSLTLPNAALGVPNSNSITYTIALSSLTSITALNVKTIGDSVFSGMKNLTSVNFPAATSIGNNAFYECFYLTSVSFPAATSIGASAFGNCRGLISIDVPAVTSIGELAFNTCDKNLTTVDLPASVNSIGVFAFSGCSNLVTFICRAIEPPNLGTNPYSPTFGGTHASFTIKVPAASVAAYQAAPGWKDYVGKIVAQ
jgi:uncharacterized protein YjdB